MNRRILIGAALLGLGGGTLLSLLFPLLIPFWPLVALLVLAMLWRRAGTAPLKVALGAVALSWAFSTINFTSERFSVPEVGGVNVSEDSRVLTTLSATDEQLANWKKAQIFKVSNAVGTVSIKSGSKLAVSVQYRANRRRAKTPDSLRATFNEATRTLTLTGVDPEASERERRGLSADIVLQVPAGVNVEVTTEVADISVAGVGKTTLTTTVGNLLTEAISGDLLASSEAGDIRVYNSEGAVDVRSNVGNLSLSFEHATESPVNARTRVGDIALKLPEASNVSLRALSDLRKFSGNLERVTPSEARLLLGDESVDVTLQTDVGEVAVSTY